MTDKDEGEQGMESPGLRTDTAKLALKVIDHVGVKLAYFDADLRCRYFNAAYQAWYELEANLDGAYLPTLLGPLWEQSRPYVERALAGEVQEFERTHLLEDGTTRYSLACYFPDVIGDRVEGFSVQVTDITRMKLLELELQAARRDAEKRATHDSLTGLLNRALLRQRITAAVKGARRRKGLAGVVVIDLDFFKQVNDTHGHLIGDQVLKTIADRMKAVSRETDTIARLGGDEFVLVVSEVESVDGILTAVDRLLDAVVQPIDLGEVQITPTLSCGIAVYPQHGRSATDLLASADKALYEAKAHGRQKTTVAA